MKTTLGPSDQDKIWRTPGQQWPFYGWRNGQWRCYPVDPRQSPAVMSTLAYGQEEGFLTHEKGFVEVGR